MFPNNHFTERLGIQYPFIQAPMLGVSTPAMAAAISNRGGLGSLAIGGLSPELTRQLIQQQKSLTNKPFAVNIFAHEIPAYDEAEVEAMRQFLLWAARDRGYSLTVADVSNFRFFTYHEQVDILIEEGIKIVSFTFGILDDATINRLHQAGCFLIGTATCVEEAKVLEQAGIDAVVAQGVEAGGHRGTFLNDRVLPQVGLFSLLPQVVEAVQVPVIAAGGINSLQAIKAANILGAAAVQVGSAFIASKESAAIPAYQQAVMEAKDTDTVLTKAFSGRWARGLRNELMNKIENSGLAIPPYPVQNSLIAQFRKLAQAAGDKEYTTLWAGQASGGGTVRESGAIFTGLVAGAFNAEEAR